MTRTFLLLLSLTGTLPGAQRGPAATTPGITLTVDCPVCGPGQALPHDCPRATNTALALLPPDPLSGLAEELRMHYRRLGTVEGVSLPPWVEPHSLDELNALLARLLAAGRTEADRLEREQAALRHEAADATQEAQRLAARLKQLSAQITDARQAFAAAGREISAAQQAAVTAREQFVALQKPAAALREQIRATRNRLFPRLQQASQRGWILPPSSYRVVPASLPLKTREVTRDGADDRLRAGTLRPTAPSSADSPRTVGESVSSRANSLPRFDPRSSESDLRARLNEFAALYYRAYTAAAQRADAAQAGSAARADSAASATSVAALEREHAAIAPQLDAQQRRLARLQQVADDERARASGASQRVLTAWVEAGIYQYLDREAESVLTSLLAQGPDATRLQSLRAVAATAAQLSAEPNGVIARLPAELATRGQSLDPVRRELAALRASLGVTFDAPSPDFPSALRPFLPEATP